MYSPLYDLYAIASFHEFLLDVNAHLQANQSIKMFLKCANLFYFTILIAKDVQHF